MSRGKARVGIRPCAGGIGAAIGHAVGHGAGFFRSAPSASGRNVTNPAMPHIREAEGWQGRYRPLSRKLKIGSLAWTEASAPGRRSKAAPRQR